MQRQPQSGDVYEFMVYALNPIKFVFNVGDRLTLIEKTNNLPHGYMSNCGYNWIVDGPNGVTVWSTIEYMLEKNWIKLVE